jgi:hypothetical protein
MKYYKITNKNETHNGMKYKTGLNIDVLPFNPSGDCEVGGIYFSREDIFAFLGYGCWIREVTIPEGEMVYENPGFPKKWKAHKVILGKRRKITAKVIEELIKEGADVNAGGVSALSLASLNGHLEVVKVLLENGADVDTNDGCALSWASENGHLEVVKLLLENGANVHARDGYALFGANMNKHMKVAKLLKKWMGKEKKKCKG